jgi:lipopolysaccharide transport system permease protein
MFKEIKNITKIDAENIKLNFYRDLILFKPFLFQLVKRNLLQVYKQTVLGPFWQIINPIVQSFVLTLIFGKFLKFDTQGIPSFLFFLSGMIIWNFFQSTTAKTSDVFTNFSNYFYNCYFPRIIIPFALVIENYIYLLLHFFIFLFFYLYFYYSGSALSINFNLIIFLPFIFIYVSVLSLSFGLIISCLSAKYRDLKVISNYFLQLFFFFTPVIYSIDLIPENYKFVYFLLNPLIYPIILFKNIFFYTPLISILFLFIGLFFCLIFFFISIYIFQKISTKVADYA